MTFDTQMHLLLLSELVFALRDSDAETFKRWVSGGIHVLGKTVVEDLMIEILNLLLSERESNRPVI